MPFTSHDLAITRYALEQQADRIERVLASQRVRARVDGGTVLPRAVRFVLQAAPGTRVAQIHRLHEDLALALNVDEVRVTRDGGVLALEVARAAPATIDLLPLLDRIPPMRGPLAVLGVASDGAPILVNFASPDVAHALLSGTTGSGKTALIRAILLSLAINCPPADLQLVLIDPKHRGLAPLAGLPHVVAGLVTDPAAAVDLLDQLVDEMMTRDQLGVSHPAIVIAIDEVVDLLMSGGQIAQAALTRLAQRGREAGLHLVLGAQKPSSKLLGSQLKANLPLRLVGRVASAQDALMAAGVGGTAAEKLTGRGDFIAVYAGHQHRFQAAWASPDALARTVADLQRGAITR